MFERSNRFRRAFKVAAIGKQRIAGRAHLGCHHIAEAVDQRAVLRPHVLAKASAKIIRARYSWPVLRSAVTAWYR